MCTLLPIVLFYGSAFAVAGFLAVCIFLLSTTETFPAIKRSKNETCFVNPVNNESISFPSIDDSSSICLSVIIPAYNEEQRLGVMLDECLEFLETRSNTSNFTYEVIIVNDGSRDGTVRVANEYCRKYGVEKFRILDLETNRGKGGAVRLGMLSARGVVLLFADADGATKFSDLVKLESAMQEIIQCDYTKDVRNAENQCGIVIASRAHLEEAAVATRSVFRTILMYGFHFLVSVFAVRGLRDTQCGFKLLTRQSARICFQSLHVERWAFDVEMLFIAQKLKMPIREIAVNWTEIDGSKVTPFWSWLQMGKDLIFIWLRYLIGAWKIRPNNAKKEE